MPLRGFTFLITGGGPDVAYAGKLLSLLGATTIQAGPSPSWGELVPAFLRLEIPAELGRLPAAGAIDGAGILESAAYPVVAAVGTTSPSDRTRDWAASGATELTGREDGLAQTPPGWAASYLRGAALAARLLARMAGGDLDVDGAALLGERAAIAGLHRRGSTSVGGAARLLPTLDGWVAVSLARPSDFGGLEAWLGEPWDRGDPWGAVTAYLAAQNAGDAVEGAQLLGIPASLVSRPEEAAADEQARARAQQWPPTPWVIGAAPAGGPVGELAEVRAVPPSRRPATGAAPLVVDLSALWAGPLCASLLGLAGARVVKVESRARPDGARRGPPGFFDLLNGGKQSVDIDPSAPDGLRVLARLLEVADIVVESARPRVMAHWGIEVDQLVAKRERLAWVSITAYGRTGPWQHRVGFGDDAAAAAGFVTGASPMFCADAFADPAAGLHASVVALAAWVGGGSHLIDVALREVVGHLLVHHDRAGRVSDDAIEVAAPRARPPIGIAPPLGRDTSAILAEL